MYRNIATNFCFISRQLLLRHQASFENAYSPVTVTREPVKIPTKSKCGVPGSSTGRAQGANPGGVGSNPTLGKTFSVRNASLIAQGNPLVINNECCCTLHLAETCLTDYPLAIYRV